MNVLPCSDYYDEIDRFRSLREQLDRIIRTPDAFVIRGSQSVHEVWWTPEGWACDCDYFVTTGWCCHSRTVEYLHQHSLVIPVRGMRNALDDVGEEVLCQNLAGALC